MDRLARPAVRSPAVARNDGRHGREVPVSVQAEQLEPEVAPGHRGARLRALEVGPCPQARAQAGREDPGGLLPAGLSGRCLCADAAGQVLARPEREGDLAQHECRPRHRGGASSRGDGARERYAAGAQRRRRRGLPGRWRPVHLSPPAGGPLGLNAGRVCCQGQLAPAPLPAGA